MVCGQGRKERKRKKKINNGERKGRIEKCKRKRTWKKAKTNKKISLLTLCDLSKAFDSVSLGTLIYKDVMAYAIKGFREVTQS